MPKRLTDKVVLITGTGGGIGRATALKFAEEGALIIGCDINTDNDNETIELVRSAGGKMETKSPVDLGNSSTAKKWVDEAFALHNRIDVVVNNASAARFAPFSEFSIEDWHFTVRNELDLVFYVSRFAWPYLQKSGGVIINLGSTAGIAGSGPGGAAHAATKGAVIALTKQLAQEGAENNIRAVTISPGFIETPPTIELFKDPAKKAVLLEGNMIKRAGQAEEIAAAAVFLAGDESGYTTGSNFVIDGGRTAW